MFGLGHEVERNRSDLHLDLILVFGRELEPEPIHFSDITQECNQPIPFFTPAKGRNEIDPFP